MNEEIREEMKATYRRFGIDPAGVKAELSDLEYEWDWVRTHIPRMDQIQPINPPQGYHETIPENECYVWDLLIRKFHHALGLAGWTWGEIVLMWHESPVIIGFKEWAIYAPMIDDEDKVSMLFITPHQLDRLGLPFRVNGLFKKWCDNPGYNIPSHDDYENSWLVFNMVINTPEN